MCGIAGYFSASGWAEDDGRALVARMIAAIDHRGPDDRGTYVDSNVGLGSARLSIIDLAGGRMPLTDDSGDRVMVMNGEIYDHLRTRERLEASGHRFATQSDAEVIPHLHAEHGADAANHLTGMFAAAVWHKSERTLWLARDRFGMKPLFFAESRDRSLLLFASEIKALLASDLVDRRLDPIGLRDAAATGYPVPPRTMVAGVQSLLPAHWMTVSAHGRRTQRYWQMPYAGLEDPGSESRALAHSRTIDEHVEELRATLDGVVRDHLLADVQVGSYLSGGLDSVTVAQRATALGSAPLRTFAMTFDGERTFDESMYSDHAAQSMNSEHVRVPQGPITEADYRGTIRAMEAPQVHTVAFCLYRLSRAVRDSGIKVVLSGEGADELFGGYAVFKLNKLRRSWLGRRSLLRRAVSRVVAGIRQPSLHRALVEWWKLEPETKARFGMVPPWIEQWWILNRGFSRLLNPDLSRAFSAGVDALPEPPMGFEAGRYSDPLQRDLAFEQQTRLDGWVLPLGDRASMAHSVEVRVPFLDHRVAELAARVPSRHLIRGSDEKHLLRTAAMGRVPIEVYARRKRSFVAPISSWLFGAQRPEYVSELLSAASLARRGLFDGAQVASRLQAAGLGARRYDALEASWSLNLALGVEVLCDEFGLSP